MGCLAATFLAPPTTPATPSPSLLRIATDQEKYVELVRPHVLLHGQPRPSFLQQVRSKGTIFPTLELVRIDHVKIGELPTVMLELVRSELVRIELVRIEEMRMRMDVGSLVTLQNVVHVSYK
ncbi:hypothetical protein F2Q70_00042333 [Brassica cretica]|uniref:Uncharacterized protein n=1 Tax=Brassica cretica TaxID=69181 RepID=A0A8S9KKP9_BRACR|nr:hypothetical protein F2Q70_00042333 [Brassica cretica]